MYYMQVMKKVSQTVVFEAPFSILKLVYDAKPSRSAEARII